ncbi:MAG: hypothetical protein NXI30_09865 [bacterium]|nr:hypothetical protein [bacterium]
MPSIRARGDRAEIRECRMTEDGPRQVVLARFRGVLTPDVLDTAAARAQRPFDRELVVERAHAAGIPVGTVRRSDAARQLLAELRAGALLDPTVVSLLQDALALQESRALPEHLADAAEWVGRSEAERGKALRGLTRAASRAAQGREDVREAAADTFPRFRSTTDRDAA